jgi:hypothetical protein
METITVGGTSYYKLFDGGADSSGLTLNASMNSMGRTLVAKSVYSLQGVSSLSASTWTMYYRAWQDSAGGSGSTLTRSPTVSSGNWENPSNAYADGGGYAYSPTKDQAETYSGYGYAISADAQITQIRVRLDAYCSDNDYLQLKVSANGGSSWLRTNSVYLTTSEVTHWVDISDWTSWTPDKINGNSLQTQIIHKKSGGGDSTSLDWVAVEVTYSVVAAVGHVDADVKVIRSDGVFRASLATNVASSGSLTTSPATLSATYAFAGYTVVSQTDYLEVDYFVDVSVSSAVNAHLRVDDSSLLQSDQTRITGISSPSSYRLNVENSYSLDLQSYPLDNLYGLRILLRYNVSSASEKWLITAYNWTSNQFSNTGFNETSGTQPAATGTWYNYALSISQNWQDYVSPNGTITLQLSDGTIGANQTSISVDFLGVNAMVGGTSISLKNVSPISVHVVALWIINLESHTRYDMDMFLTSGEAVVYTFGLDITVPDGNFIVKVVTERGNIAINSTDWQS